MSERTYLTTTYKERERVKALGARWDADVRQWYVPAGVDLAAFATWLPAGTAVETLTPARVLSQETSGEVSTVVKGVPLSRLLSGVAAVVAKAFSEGVWTTAEVLKASVSKGHVYLELSERNPATGEVLAQARAVIWARTAQPLLAEFKRVTGADLDAGIKVLLRAKPVFKSQFGFSLEVDGIDPAYTVGDLEARRRDIRERLKREGLFDLNRRLLSPWDFSAVLVIAPERAAGLGDFAKEAERLQAHGACEFSYVHSRFQGEGAAAEITQAIRAGLRSWSGATLPDAVVIIRGGGSVSDLAWLNDYVLAKCICECPVPVFSGIGHERDDTTVDEVAHRKFDTPSKVILGIEDIMRARVREATALFDSVLSASRSTVSAASVQAINLRQSIEQAAKTAVGQARANSKAAFSALRHEAVSTLQAAHSGIREDFLAVSSHSKALVIDAKKTVPALMSEIDTRGHASIAIARERAEGLLPLIVERTSSASRTARHAVENAFRETLRASVQVGQVKKTVEALLPTVLERASGHARTARQAADWAVREVAERATQGVDVASERSQALFREIAGQGPQKTLRRGFAVVRASGGQAVTAAASVQPGSAIRVDLHDGTVDAVVKTVQSGSDNGG